MIDDIKRMAIDLGADVCGIANIKEFSDTPKGFHPLDIYEDCKSVIVFGISIPKGLYQAKSRLVYGYFNNFACPEIDRIAFYLSKRIEDELDCHAMPMASDGPYEYWDADNMEGRGDISMKHAAVLAGIGALGKSTLLLNPKYGNTLIIGAIFTNLDLPSDARCKNICIDSCTLCIDNCPTGALDGSKADQKKCRPCAYNKNERGFKTVDCFTCRSICPVRFGENS